MHLLLVALLGALVTAHGALPDYPLTFGEMKVKAGYYTEGGKYLGGLPRAKKTEREILECLQYSDGPATIGFSSTVIEKDPNANITCVEWRADEAGGKTFHLGRCSCKMFGGRGNYCASWTCSMESRSYRDYSVDAAVCECDQEHDSGYFCDTWSCKQVDSSSRVELEEYTCLDVSASGMYCQAWTGEITAKDEIEVLACHCVAEWKSSAVCSYWECEELGLGICSKSGPSWCNSKVSLIIGVVIGIWGIVMIMMSCCANGAKSSARCSFLLTGVVWCAIWAIPVVIMGGEDAAKVVGIIWFAPLLIGAAASALSYGAKHRTPGSQIE